MHSRLVHSILAVLLLSILLVSSFYLSVTLLRIYAPQETISSSAPALKVKKAESPSPPATVRFDPPVRLEIASISVDAQINPVGITSEGNMAIDADIAKVAWYEPGPRPGEKGSAVIAGHYGWKSGQPSVFNDLRTLQPGDRVATYDTSGSLVSFIVSKVKTFNPSADTSEVFRSSDDNAHLNLITCEGAWVSNQQTYSERLVVFTDKEG